MGHDRCHPRPDPLDDHRARPSHRCAATAARIRPTTGRSSSRSAAGRSSAELGRDHRRNRAGRHALPIAGLPVADARSSSHDSRSMPPTTQLFDAELVIYRLEEAGATLLALPGTGWSTRLRGSSLEIVRAAVESYGWSDEAYPSADSVGRADHPHGRGAGVDPADPDRPLCAAADRRRPQPGAPDHRAAPVSLASCSPPRSAPTTRRLSAGIPRGST